MAFLAAPLFLKASIAVAGVGIITAGGYAVGQTIESDRRSKEMESLRKSMGELQKKIEELQYHIDRASNEYEKLLALTKEKDRQIAVLLEMTQQLLKLHNH